MDNKTISISKDNFLPRSRIIGIFFTDSSPMRQIISKKRDELLLIDATRGKKTRSAILLDNGYLVLSHYQPSTISQKFEQD